MNNFHRAILHSLFHAGASRRRLSVGPAILSSCVLAVLLFFGTAGPASAEDTTKTEGSNKYGRKGSEVKTYRNNVIIEIKFYDECGRLREDRFYKDPPLSGLLEIDYYSPDGTSKLETFLHDPPNPTTYIYTDSNRKTRRLTQNRGQEIIEEWRNAPVPPCPPPKTTGGVKITPNSSILFRTGEVELNLFGAGGVGHGEQTVTSEETVKRTETVTETTTVTETVLKDIPGIPGLTPVDTDVLVTKKHDVTVKKKVKTTRNAAPIQGGFGGTGADAKYFVTPNIGLGLQGEWLDGESSIGTTFGTLTARFPMGSNAPYLFGGAGVQFGDRTRAVGELGGGIEHRFSPSTGIFVDAAWMFSEHENAAVFRAGVSLIFGPQELPPPSKK